MIPRFRAWDKKNNAMTDVRAIDFDEKTINDYLHGGKSPKRYFDDIVLMQSTGLFDKNGVEIFEGDICNCREYECYGVIKWNEDYAGFYFYVAYGDGTFDEEDLYDYIDELEVIGNVHATPELVEVEE